MKLSVILLISCLAFLGCQSKYIIGEQGDSCTQACFKQNMNCNPVVITNNNIAIFAELGIICQPNTKPWFAEDQPSFVSGKSDPNYGKCMGYVNVPSATQCYGSQVSVRRLCNCDAPSTSDSTFGTGFSGGSIATQETFVFAHVLASGDVGALTHFWTTYGSDADNGTLISYYIDGETTPSIQFTPSLACGVGFYDKQGPWGTEWFGKGAADSGWFNNFKIPFQKSIVVTTRHLYANHGGFYMIVRGSTNVPIVVGGVTLPKKARMVQTIINDVFQPLAWVPLVNITSGPGAHWMVTLSAQSGNMVFLEGCVHAYLNGNNAFPGVVLGTGTEDYFDSAWYFNGGEFHLPVAGFTHFTQDSSKVTWSAYRFHDQDPLFFQNGFQLIWRNGDQVDAAGMKCFVISGGSTVGNPTDAIVAAYSWTYTWPSSSDKITE